MRASHCGPLFALALLLSACSPEPERARYTVEDYRANDALREAKVKECTNDPGTLGQTPDCVNALSAASLEGRGSLRKSPPVGLDPARNPFGDRVPPQEEGAEQREPASASQPRPTP